MISAKDMIITDVSFNHSLYSTIMSNKQDFKYGATFCLKIDDLTANKKIKITLNDINRIGGQCVVLDVDNDTLKPNNAQVENSKNIRVLKAYRENISPVLDTIRQISHKNIEKYYDVLVYNGFRSNIFAERLDHDLDGFQCKENIVQIYENVLSGLEFLHGTLRIMHGDLKCGNIMYSARDGLFKIIDFGMSEYENEFRTKPYFINYYMTPPSLFKDRTDWGYYLDLWNFALVLFQLFTDTCFTDKEFDAYETSSHDSSQVLADEQGYLIITNVMKKFEKQYIQLEKLLSKSKRKEKYTSKYLIFSIMLILFNSKTIAEFKGTHATELFSDLKKLYSKINL